MSTCSQEEDVVVVTYCSRPKGHGFFAQGLTVGQAAVRLTRDLAKQGMWRWPLVASCRAVVCPREPCCAASRCGGHVQVCAACRTLGFFLTGNGCCRVLTASGTCRVYRYGGRANAHMHARAHKHIHTHTHAHAACGRTCTRA